MDSDEHSEESRDKFKNKKKIVTDSIVKLNNLFTLLGLEHNSKRRKWYMPRKKIMLLSEINTMAEGLYELKGKKIFNEDLLNEMQKFIIEGPLDTMDANVKLTEIDSILMFLYELEFNYPNFYDCIKNEIEKDSTDGNIESKIKKITTEVVWLKKTDSFFKDVEAKWNDKDTYKEFTTSKAKAIRAEIESEISIKTCFDIRDTMDKIMEKIKNIDDLKETYQGGATLSKKKNAKRQLDEKIAQNKEKANNHLRSILKDLRKIKKHELFVNNATKLLLDANNSP